MLNIDEDVEATPRNRNTGLIPSDDLDIIMRRCWGEIRNDEPDTEPVCQDGVEPVMVLERRRQRDPL